MYNQIRRPETKTDCRELAQDLISSWKLLKVKYPSSLNTSYHTSTKIDSSKLKYRNKGHIFSKWLIILQVNVNHLS